MTEILFSDEYITICKKEAGQLSEDSDSPQSLPNILRNETGHDIYTLHRLDKPVGGVIIYANTKAAASKFTALITSENGITKRYLTVCDGVLTDNEGEMRDLLFHDRQRNKTFCVKRMRKGVKEAILKYKVIDVNENKSLLEIELITGRTHQIRAQLASRKIPVTGDGKYGSRDNKCTTALFSHSVTFVHPFTGEKISVSAMPDFTQYPWSLFQNIK